MQPHTNFASYPASRAFHCLVSPPQTFFYYTSQMQLQPVYFYGPPTNYQGNAISSNLSREKTTDLSQIQPELSFHSARRSNNKFALPSERSVRSEIEFQQPFIAEITQTSKGCSCTKIKCLKDYCPCHKSNKCCGPSCVCKRCRNTQPPPNLLPSSTKCKCTKSSCILNYCECFKSNGLCGIHCLCQNCKNKAPNSE